MFEQICVLPNEPDGTEFDLGLLAEALLFYGTVHIILRRPNLRGLLRQIGPDVLFELIGSHNLKVRYLDRFLGAITANKGTPLELHDVGIINAEKDDLEKAAAEVFADSIGTSREGKRIAERFCQSVQPIQYVEGITAHITEDMKAGTYITEYIRRRLTTLGVDAGSKLPDDFRYFFSLIPGKGFKLLSNFDLREIAPTLQEIVNPAYVLANYGTTIANMSLWGQLSTEVAVYPRQADVIGARLDPMLAKYRGDQEKLSAFQDFAFDDSRAIREAINQGIRNFVDLLPLLEKSRRFKEWLLGQPPDRNLLKEYHREVTAGSWIDGLPGKSSRWVVFTLTGLATDAQGAGGIGTAIGIALSALDSFFLDCILKGWRPHQFVEGPLRSFVATKR